MMKRMIFLLFSMVLLFSQQSVMVADEVEDAPSCLFFTETASQGGFSVCDDGEARFRSAFEGWGLQNIGYPISRRYVYDGFVTQVFQKAIMQWRPDGDYVALINIFDDLHNAGFDDRLFVYRQTPNQLPAGWDGDIPFGEVIKKRQALLNERPALRDAYFASPDPLMLYGLPTSEVEDMGNHYAIRLQRTVLQEWKEEVPWAPAGHVTVANGGDIAKELDFLPASPLIPEDEANSGLDQLDLLFYRGDTLHYAAATWQPSTLNEPFTALKHQAIDECMILEQGPTEVRGHFRTKKLGQITYEVYPEFNPGANRPSSDINKLYVARPDFRPLFIVIGPTDKWAQCETDAEAVLATLRAIGGGSGLNTAGTIRGAINNQGTPAIKIYALRVDRDAYYYVDSPEGAESYEIEVAPGKYEVIGYIGRSSLMPYSEATRCRLEPDCDPGGSFFKLAVVTVPPGESVSRIDLNFNFFSPRSYPLPPSALASQDLRQDRFSAIYGELPTSAETPVRVYAQRVDREAITYITDVTPGEQIYRLLLSAGDYKVFAYTLDGEFVGSYRTNNEKLAVVKVKAGERLAQKHLQAEGPNVPQPEGSLEPLDPALTELSLRNSPLTLSYNASEWQLLEDTDTRNSIYNYLQHKTIAGCELIHDLAVSEVGGPLWNTIAGPIAFDLYPGVDIIPENGQRTVLYQPRSGFISSDQPDVYGIERPPMSLVAPINKWEACQVAAHGVLATLRLDTQKVQPDPSTYQLDLSIYPFKLTYGAMWLTRQYDSVTVLTHKDMRGCHLYEEKPRSLPSGDFTTKSIGNITADVYPIFDDIAGRPTSGVVKLYIPRAGFDNPGGSVPLFIVTGSPRNWPECRAQAENVLSTLNP
ncbi:MAG: hypothetical protein ACPGWR_26210 [Ardenticatenaceae bacterium]